MTFNDRASYALDRLRAGTSVEGRPSAEHTLALALETMFRTGNDYCALTESEVERFVPTAANRNGFRIIRRVLDTGALEEVAGDRFRIASLPPNVRMVRLPGAAIDVADPDASAAIDVGDAAIDVGPCAAIDVQLTISSKTTNTNNSNSYARGDSVPDAGEFVRAMEPRNRIWTHTGNLNSQAARVYGVVATNPTPTTPADVCRVLNRDATIGNRGAKDTLRNLGKHGLIVRSSDDTGWIAGSVTPATHDPARCPACVPRSGIESSTPSLGDRQAVSRPHSSSQAQDDPCACHPDRPEPFYVRADGRHVCSLPTTGTVYAQIGPDLFPVDSQSGRRRFGTPVLRPGDPAYPL